MTDTTRKDQMTTKTKPAPASTVVTTIPTTTDVATLPPQSTAITRYSITEADVAAIEAKRGLIVSDIRDTKQIKAVEQLHREAKKGRTTIEAERTDANKSLRAKIEDEIKWNNNAAAALQSRLNPIEEEAAAEIARVEAEQEAERVAAKAAILNARKAAMAEIVGEFKDMLAPYPDDYLSNVPEAVFNPLLVTLGVQVEGRKQMAEQQAAQKAREEQAAKELAERERSEKEAREKQRAIDDEARKAAQEKLDADRKAFDEQRFAAGELQRKADEARDRRLAQETADRERRESEQRAAEKAVLDAERAELEKQRAEIAAERQRQETARLEQERITREAEQAERDRLRLVAERDLYAARVPILDAIGDCGKEAVNSIGRDRMIRMTDEEFSEETEEVARQQRMRDATAARIEADKSEAANREEAIRPDIEKITEWLDRIGQFTAENLPQMGTEAGQELLVELRAAIAESMDYWRGMLA